MKKIVLALNYVIAFSITFSAFGMQIETNKKEIVFQSHFNNDLEYFKTFMDLSKDFEWNDTGKIDISPVEKLIQDKNAGEKIEYTYHAQEKIPLPINNQDRTNTIGKTLAPSLKSLCFNHILQNNKSANSICIDMIDESCREDLLEKNYFEDDNNFDFTQILKQMNPHMAIHFLRHPQFKLKDKKQFIELLKLDSKEKLAQITLLDGLENKAKTYYEQKNFQNLKNALALGADPYIVLEKLANHIDSCNNSHNKDEKRCYENEECNLHDSILAWTFENYPYYTAYNLYKIFYENYRDNSNTGQKIIEIIKSHDVLQHTFEKVCNSESKDIKTSECTFTLFLKHSVILTHIEQSEELKKELIGNATIETLLSLKQREITFNNPDLINIAEQLKNPLILSFILNEQKKLDEKPHAYFRRFLNNNPDHDKLIFYPNKPKISSPNKKNFSNNSISHKYHTLVYKKMLDARYSRDMRPLENIILSPDWPIWLETGEDTKKLNFLSSEIGNSHPDRKNNKEFFDSFDQTYSNIIKKLKSHHNIPPKIISCMLKNLSPAPHFSRYVFDFYDSDLTGLAVYTYNTFYSLLTVLSTKSPGIFPLILAGGAFVCGAAGLGIDCNIKLFPYKRLSRFKQYYYLQGFLQALTTNNVYNFQLLQENTDKKINSKKIMAKLFLRKKKSEYLNHISTAFLGLAIGKFLQFVTFCYLDNVESGWPFLYSVGAGFMYYLLGPGDYYYNDHSYQEENYASDIKQLEKSYIQQGMKDGLEHLQKYKQYKEKIAAKKFQSNLTNMFTQLRLHKISEIYEKYRDKKTNNEEL